MILRTSQKQLLKTILAPSMQQSIEVLMLPLLDLNTAIEQELQENPLLEIDEEKARLKEKTLEEAVNQHVDNANESHSFSGYKDNFDDDAIENMPISYQEPLEAQLLRQLHLELSDPLEIKIGEFFIGNLDEDGYLTCQLEEVQEALQIQDKEKIEKVLSIVQNFEPIGISARNVKECLTVQANAKFNGQSGLLIDLINHHLEDLAKKRYERIARQLKVDAEKIKELAACVSSLEPKPARNYRPLRASTYIKPDAIIFQDEHEEYKVFINEDTVPPLRVSKVYSNILKAENCSDEEKEYIREKVKHAMLFIRSIQQRHNTLREIAKYITDYQKEFFEKGHMYLKPMSLKDVAQSISRNESTVSRAVNNKYIDTPCGIFPLKYFFSQSMADCDGGDVSNRSIKEELKKLIDGEAKSHPFSDRELHLHFERKNMKVARRTITKYRKALKILPAYLRKS